MPNKTCHAEEQSDEASLHYSKDEILRFAQNDKRSVLLGALKVSLAELFSGAPINHARDDESLPDKPLGSLEGQP